LNKRQVAVGKSFILNDPAIRERSVRYLYRTADTKNSPQSIARIDRTFVNIAICRAFLRATLQEVIDRQWIVIDRHDRYRPLIDRMEMSRFAGLSPPH
jgi:hypothetical protein